VDLHIPNGAIIPLFIVSFVMLALQYFRLNPERRVINLHFGLMVGAVALMFVTVFLGNMHISLVFFLLALFWTALTLFLFRHMPPPRH
jgi:hypothetical protein